MLENHQKHPPQEIPVEQLSNDAIDGVIKSFIMREGTDYGAVEVSLEAKFAQIKKQIDSGKVKIVFDPNEQTVTLIALADWLKLSKDIIESY